MFFGIEFGKIVRRKFNYAFALVTLLISAIMVFRVDVFSSYYNVTSVNFTYDFIFKIILVLVIFIMGINYIYSYREDYTDGVSILLKLTKNIGLRDCFSLVASVIYFLIYYVVLVVLSLVIIFIKDNTLFTNVVEAGNIGNFVTYFLIVVLLFVFANLIFLLALSLFNNTNLAIALSLLYFVGAETFANSLTFLSDRFDNNILTIFSKTFNDLNQYVYFNATNFLSLVLNIVGLVVVIVIVRVIKKIII